MKKLYFFDFDGTLTLKDSMFAFLKFYNSNTFYWQFIKHIPLFILLKIKLLDAEAVKRSFIASILKGEKKSKLEEKAQAFFQKNYPELIRSNALDFIRNMDRDNTEAYLVTASVDIWTKPFADAFGFTLLATQALFENDIFTGKFQTKNCNGQEKVNRILQEIKDKKYDKTIAFGDTSGDQPMLQWANEGHFRFFH